MNAQHTKALNTDTSSKNRLRFASTRQLSKLASADVYRSYKRKVGVVTSASNREEQVHRTQSPTKRHKANPITLNINDEKFDSIQSIFSSELDVTADRNASDVFSKFYRDIWPLCRSLPEVLHHSSSIIDTLLFYLLSRSENGRDVTTAEEDSSSDHNCEDNDEIDECSNISSNAAANKTVTVIDGITTKASDTERSSFIVNHATTDILHLISVLARDLRHEIHPYVHTKILPRILIDLLNPPPPLDTNVQPIQLDVNVVESAFRTL
jgi:hypothetical protein